ncbi:MAG: 50S ribosomal protein L21 [Patescibacteria group bacterium]|nr:50S ribosomal protein L21 [Patescibacteria group bacterium]
MFAVVKTGGKQYIVREGDTLDIEKIEGKKGEKASLDQILLLSTGDSIKVGTPTVTGIRVEIEIVDQFKAKKVEMIKYKKKTGYRRKKGHRQNKTKVKILKINA